MRLIFQLLRAIIKPALFLCLLFALILINKNYLLRQVDNGVAVGVQQDLHKLLLIMLWFTAGFIANRLIHFFFWRPRISHPSKDIPKLLQDGVAVLIVLISSTGIIYYVFDQSISGILAASGVAGLVIGLAVREMIADAFSGVAINLDKTIKMNDWITFYRRGTEPVTGCVKEINWRSTRLKTTDNVMVVIPNSLIAANVVKNLSEPEEKSRFELVFTLDYNVPVDRALRVLNAGVKSSEGILHDPPPKARADKVSHTGIDYKIRYWLLPSKFSPQKGRNAVVSSVIHHLNHAGISLAYPKQDLFLSRMPLRQLDRHSDCGKLLQRIELFANLSPQEISFLAAHIHYLEFEQGAAIVRSGEKGTSMFILVEGLLHVFIHEGGEGEHREIQVGQIIPGNFFGEMSLLTGAVRSATIYATTDCVVYEITKRVMEKLLAKRPSIAEDLSDIIAQRDVENLKAKENFNGSLRPPLKEDLATAILNKMKKFFSVFQ